MAWTKTTAVISNNISLTAGGGPTTSSSQDTTTTGVKHIYLKLTNGATGPAVPASATVQSSADNSNFYDFYTFTGGTGNNEVKSISFQLMAPVQYIRVVWTHGSTGSAITARAEISQVSEWANSLTGSSATSNACADNSNTSLRTNLYNEIGTSFAHNQTSVGTSAVQLASNTSTKGVLVKAKSTNTGIIYVGNSSGVTSSTGFELLAGEAVLVPVNNSNLIYCIASASSQAVCLLVT